MRQPLTPASFDWAVRRCLAKNPDERWQTARDLSAELSWILATGQQEIAPVRTVKRRRAAVAGASVAALAILMMAMIPMLRPSPSALPVFHQITFRRGVITSARFAPDGQTIVYSASWEGEPHELFLTRQGSNESRPLGIPQARLFGISASGEMVFMRGRQTVFRSLGTLARVPLAGGAPRDVLENVITADWSPDEAEIAVVRAIDGGRVQVEFPIGTKIYESSSHVGSIRVSPRGDRVAFIEGQGEGGARIVVVDRGGRTTVLSRGLISALTLAWSRDASEIWFTGTRGDVPPAIRAVSLDGRERILAPAPDVLQLQDVFRDGRVLAVRHHGREGFACRAPGETADRDLSWYDGSAIEALSPDGRTALFGEVRGGGARNQGIYLRRTGGSAAVRLANGYPEDLSPDGRWVLARPEAAGLADASVGDSGRAVRRGRLRRGARVVCDRRRRRPTVAFPLLRGFGGAMESGRALPLRRARAAMVGYPGDDLPDDGSRHRQNRCRRRPAPILENGESGGHRRPRGDQQPVHHTGRHGVLLRVPTDAVRSVRHRRNQVTRLCFGECVFDGDSRELLRANRSVPLSPKAFQLLQILIENRPKALSKSDLHDRLWPDTFVVDANLSNLVGEVRRAIGDDRRHPRFVRTVHRFGYGFRTELVPSDAAHRTVLRLEWPGGRVLLSEGEHIVGRDPNAAVATASSAKMP